MWVIETTIRTIARDNRNSYQIGLFACCREIYNPLNHVGLFSGTKEEALAYYTQQMNLLKDDKETT